MSSFNFKEFSISQDRSAMKVGTDGVLLGAWVSVSEESDSILDSGTGTGVIAIMMAQRSSADRIVGVEIVEDSALDAAHNMASSPWSERLSVERVAVQEYTPSDGFDIIISNPPYFIDSLQAKGANRTTARHTTELSFEDLVAAVQRLLNPEGHFALILPLAESQRFDSAAKGVLNLARRCYVRGKVGGEIKRVMSEYRLAPLAEVNTSELTIRDTSPNGYTSEYRELTADFYLKF